jgi:hypothetical protein
MLPIYASGELSAELRQGEIITAIGKYVVNPSTKDVSVERYDYAIIATQDCDLLQDYNLRSEQKDSPLSGVLLFPMDAALSVRERFKGSEARTRVFQNKDERYHMFERVGSDFDLQGVGLPPLLVDFKRFFTITPTEIFYQIEGGTATRRCRLEMPYREHFQTRAAFYFQRIMLPEQHKFNFEEETARLKAVANREPTKQL